MSAQTHNRRLFVQMAGAPGAGKSTVATLLAPAIGAVVLDHDVLRSSLVESRVPFADAARHAYRLQWTLADALVRQGFSVVVDSPCHFPEILAQGASCAREHGYAYWYVECRVRDIDLLDRRLRARARARGAMASQRTGVDRPPAGAAAGSAHGQDARALFQKWMEHPCRPQDHVVVVDATEDPEMLRDSILKRILG